MGHSLITLSLYAHLLHVHRVYTTAFGLHVLRLLRMEMYVHAVAAVHFVRSSEHVRIGLHAGPIREALLAMNVKINAVS
jgi:hypothetical protein